MGEHDELQTAAALILEGFPGSIWKLDVTGNG